MHRLAVLLMILAAFTGIATAEKPAFDEPSQPSRIPCNLTTIVYDWDFAIGDHGFMQALCEIGGTPVWEYGPTSYIPGAPGNVWGTVLNAAYPNNSGDGLLAPAIFIDESTVLMEVHHWFDIETNYDGCNVTVNGEVIEPMGSYTVPAISTSTTFFAFCVDLEPGWTGHDAMWTYSCFDLSPFIGNEIWIGFDFGSDSSVTYPGWYIASVKIGNADVTPTDGDTWGKIKGMFR